jgi:dimethylhistidine N-methyltransferase
MNIKEFKTDVIQGLNSPKKSLPSKYFYDEKGSFIFQEIMEMEEYYLPGCEIEILQNQSGDIIGEIPFESLDVFELGAGDGSKTVIFLEEMLRLEKKFTYIPMDISKDILKANQEYMSIKLPQIPVSPMHGDYFVTMSELMNRKLPKLVMFMGSNIGNFKIESSINFIRFINGFLNEGDFFLMGVDLKKDPNIIRAAYNDKAGITKRFNLNLLERINRELSGDFDLLAFDHYGIYNPMDGAALSFLISLKKQKVCIGDKFFFFEKYEAIHTEISQKYSLKDLDQLANQTGFSWDNHFTDSKRFYTLSLFRK